MTEHADASEMDRMAVGDAGWMMEGGLVYPIGCVYSGSLLLLLAASHSHSPSVLHI